MSLRIVILWLLACACASGQLIGPGAVRTTSPRAPGNVRSQLPSGNPTPVWFLVTNIVDVSTQYNTNTVDTTGLPATCLLVSIWHTYQVTNPQTNLANGIVMTVLQQTNSYSGVTGTNYGFGIAYLVPPSNGVFKVAYNCDNSGGIETSFSTLVYTNVHQTTPFGTAVVDWSGVARPGMTNTVTSAANDLIFDAIAWNDGAVGSVGAGQTRRALADPAPNDSSLASSEKTSEGATSTMRWSGFTSAQKSWIGAAMKAP